HRGEALLQIQVVSNVFTDDVTPGRGSGHQKHDAQFNLSPRPLGFHQRPVALVGRLVDGRRGVLGYVSHQFYPQMSNRPGPTTPVMASSIQSIVVKPLPWFVGFSTSEIRRSSSGGKAKFVIFTP